jgi:hypothetical protein
MSRLRAPTNSPSSTRNRVRSVYWRIFSRTLFIAFWLGQA